MTGPRSAEVTTVSRILRKDWLTRDLVCCGDEARRSAPGVNRAHPLLRWARASLTALGGVFARQPHAALFFENNVVGVIRVGKVCRALNESSALRDAS